MKLIYYYSENKNAPAAVSRDLYNYLKSCKIDFELVRYPSNNIFNQFRNLYNLNRNDILGVHIPTSPFFAPTKRFLLHIFAMLFKIPLILNLHGDVKTETLYQLKNRSWLNFIKYLPSSISVAYFLKKASVVVVNSPSMKSLLSSRYKIQKNILVIPNAINDFWFEGNTNKIKLEGSPKIFYHGRLSHEKGVDLLLKGFSKSKNLNSRLYIAGSGPQLAHLKAIAKEEGIERRVTFLGVLSNEKLKSYLSNVDLAIYPSRYEPFSLAIVEAFATVNGLVFYSKEAGINDFSRSMNFKLMSFSPSVEAITKIIDTEYSDSQIDNIVLSQRKFAKFFTWDKVADKYLSLYHNLLKNYPII